MRILIGLTGLMGSGKSAVAEHISEKYDFTHMRISNKMKEIARELNIEPSRDFLQKLALLIREFDNDVWIKYLVKKIQNTSSSIVIDDIRRKNEIDYLKALGFKFIKIESSSSTRRQRIESRDNIKITNQDWKRWSEHMTESQVSQLPVEFTIKNDGSFEELKNQVDIMMSKIMSEE